MQSSQFTARQLLGVLKRRRTLLLLPVVRVTCLCVVGAYMLRDKYDSGVTVIVQQDEVLNPLVSYDMAVTMASDDQLKTFNEIIYSKSTIEMLIDTLRIDGGLRALTEEQEQKLVQKMRKNIATERPGSTSFRITYLDTDPYRAKRGVQILSDYFIKTILHVENQRNELALKFFEGKLEELRQRFEESQSKLIASMKRNIEAQPTGNTVLDVQIQESEKRLGTTESRIKLYERALAMLNKFPDAANTDEGEDLMFAIGRMDLPYSYDLTPLLSKYQDVSRRYTPRYPEVVRLRGQILDMFTLMKSAIQSELARQRSDMLEIERQRSALVENLKRSSVSQQEGQGERSDYDIYKKLYDDMQVKVEQARTNRDLGREGKNQFIVIDPPMVPTEPAKPNRTLIIAGGTFLGFFIGFLTAGTAELLDSTILSKKDVEVYQRPVIAFVPEGGLS